MFNKKNLLTKKAGMSYVQILIILVATFAFAYLVYSNITPVNALSDLQACCERNINGGICTNSPESECNPEFQSSPTTCDQTDFCKTGCCISPTRGICTQQATKDECLAGTYIEDNPFCMISDCKAGCCIIGNQAKFINENECQFEAQSRGWPVNFRGDVKSLLECRYLTETDDEGACIYEVKEGLITNKECVYMSREECVTRTGNDNNFFKDTYCSNPDLNTTCSAHNSTGCVEGLEEVYWFDSCGNKEEVYETCAVLFGSICGEYREGVDAQAPNFGNYVCRDLGCDVKIDGQDVKKRNGESWCEYESCIGDGKDAVGSRHIRRICFMGEEKVEPCADYRNQICVGSDTELSDGTIFQEAYCRANRWRSCYNYNKESDGMKQKCEENPDCYINSVNVDEGFKFDICVPNYPPGFDIKNEDPMRNGEAECSMASQQCIVMYVKRVSGWECEVNCKCEDTGFTQQMNDLCRSLGDCGAYTNWVGKTTDDGYGVKGAGKIDENQYASCGAPQPGQKPAKRGRFGMSGVLGIPDDLGGVGEVEEGTDLSMLGASLSGVGLLGDATQVAAATSTATIAAIPGTTITPATIPVENFQYIRTDAITGAKESFKGIEAAAEFGKDSGWSNVDMMDGGNPAALKAPDGGGLSLQTDTGSIPIEGPPAPSGAEKIVEGGGEVPLEGGGGEAAAQTGQVGMKEVLGAIGAGLSVASFLQAGFGLDAGASYGIGGGYALLMLNPAFAAVLGPLSLGLAIYSMIAGLGKTKEKIVKFNCYQWQPEFGGDDCEKCNEEGVLCSDYKCNSLGQTCEFINQRTKDEKCINNDPHDVSSPKIQPLINTVTQGYQYIKTNEGFRIRGTGGSCIPEYTRVNFGIETTAPSQCKMGSTLEQPYEEMNNYFGETNSYITNHEMELFLPSPRAFAHRYNLTAKQIEEMGQIKYYVKCRSLNGIVSPTPYVIDVCLQPGQDLTVPGIDSSLPENNGFIKFGATSSPAVFWVNEPSDCKWSTSADKEYNEMEHEMLCRNEFEDYGRGGKPGWPCVANLTDISPDSSQFYVKCKDQPWLPESNDSRNTMTNPYSYLLAVSPTPLVIKETLPKQNNVITSGFEPIPLSMKLQTIGGAENGKSICSWEEGKFSDQFTTTNAQYHEYADILFFKGTHEINYTCIDVAGNIAQNTTSFKIQVDSKGPQITRVYYDGGLKVITSENSDCRYSFDRKFVFENATLMGSNVRVHTAPWQLKTYYVQCQDKYENKGSKKIIKAYDLL